MAPHQVEEGSIQLNYHKLMALTLFLYHFWWKCATVFTVRNAIIAIGAISVCMTGGASYIHVFRRSRAMKSRQRWKVFHWFTWYFVYYLATVALVMLMIAYGPIVLLCENLCGCARIRSAFDLLRRQS